MCPPGRRQIHHPRLFAYHRIPAFTQPSPTPPQPVKPTRSDAAARLRKPRTTPILEASGNARRRSVLRPPTQRIPTVHDPSPLEEETAMEGGGAGGGGGGGPAPFLQKTYEMVEDSATDEIVSWSAAKNSFVVWNPPEFARVLLPTYFKHNNFSSFIRQLNTYGFRKIDPERWEFQNEDFLQGQKDLLKNIHRRKPIYSHSQTPGSADSERASLGEEIERLNREKTALQANLSRFKQQQSRTKLQLEDLDRRVQDMERRQHNMKSFLARAVRNPVFVEHLVQMVGAVPVDLFEAHKKRRLPGDGEGAAEISLEIPDNSFHDNHSSSLKPDVCRLFDQDFSSKLKLELCPAISDSNLLSPSTQGSNEDGFSTPRRQVEGGGHMRPECPSILPEAMELSDTGTSCCPRKNNSFPWQVRNPEEGDNYISCHLNLTLASSPLQFESSFSSAGIQTSASHETCNTVEPRESNSSKEDDFARVSGKTQNVPVDGNANASPLLEANPSISQAPAVAAAVRGNDKFWEQFLTERPGCSDTEEPSSGLRTNSLAEQQEQKKPEAENLWRSRKDIEQLTL